jgi:hypothetical protein
LQFGDRAGVTVDLLDPGADPQTGRDDGLIRLGELLAGEGLATSTTVDDPRAKDVVLTLAPQAAALTETGARPFLLDNPEIEFAWANLAAPAGVHKGNCARNGVAEKRQ